MSVVLFDLACAQDERRFSPFCWRTRLALAHKGLEVETRPWRMVEKDAIAMSGQGKVPVIIDDGQVVFDSWTIAQYLEDTYADAPSLFGGGGPAAYEFIRNWADGVLLPFVARMAMADILSHLHDKDRSYFREVREAAFGATIEQVSADRDERIVEFRTRLEPLRRQFGAHPFIGGETPDYADYVVASIFLMSRAVSPFRLLAAGDVIGDWAERMLDVHDGLARATPGYAIWGSAGEA